MESSPLEPVMAILLWRKIASLALWALLGPNAWLATYILPLTVLLSFSLHSPNILMYSEGDLRVSSIMGHPLDSTSGRGEMFMLLYFGTTFVSTRYKSPFVCYDLRWFEICCCSLLFLFCSRKFYAKKRRPRVSINTCFFEVLEEISRVTWRRKCVSVE